MAEFAEVFVEFLPTTEGGRRTPVSLRRDARYMPHFVVHDGDGEYLGIEFVDGPDDWIDPGGSAHAKVRFMYEPEVSYDSLRVGVTFDVREGGRTVGVGRVVRR